MVAAADSPKVDGGTCSRIFISSAFLALEREDEHTSDVYPKTVPHRDDDLAVTGTGVTGDTERELGVQGLANLGPSFGSWVSPCRMRRTI